MRDLAVGIGFVLPLCWVATAQAEWTKLSGGNNGPTLLDVSAPTSQHLFALGVQLVPDGIFFRVVTSVFASSNGGQQLQNVTGNLTPGALSAPAALSFPDAQRGYVAVDHQVWRTNVGGNTWAAIDVGCTVTDLHFFDLEQGLLTCDGGEIKLTGNGGATWTAVASPVTVPLRHLFWLDRQHGWASGYRTEEGEDGTGNPTTGYHDGVVLRTIDGGATWQMAIVPPGMAPGELFFLGDGTTGWLAASVFVDADHNDARLLRTTDGGANFTDTNLPLQVGTLQMIMSKPINLSSINTLVWSDAQNGHLGGTAFLLKTSGDGAATVWRTVDYITDDGGSSWARTDLGTITVAIGPQIQLPPNDGRTTAGVMHDFYQGVMVGERQVVFSYDHTCAGAGDCVTGYACETDTCVPLPCNPACGADEYCAQGACEPIGSDPGSTDEDDATRPPTAPKSFTEDGGCSSGHRPSGWTLVAVVAGLGWRRRHRRLCRT